MRKVDDSLAVWLQAFNHELAATMIAGVEFSTINVRAGLATITRTYITEIPHIDMVVDDIIEHVPIRVYHPQPQVALPVLVYLHGGGHVAGSLDVYDPICRKLALACQYIIVAIDYRLAPEYPYPAAINDVRLCLQHLFSRLNNMAVNYIPYLAIGGDSAGGALAATVCAIVQNDEVHISKQVLIYPSLDYTLSSPSVMMNGNDYFLQINKVRWYFDQYFQNNQNRYSASPLWLPVCANFPETLVITTEFCPLRDEGITYYNKLRQQGIEAQHYHVSDMVHAFLNLENVVPQHCRQLYTVMGQFLTAERGMIKSRK
ncbi:alpha/beta hydrolase [Photobacterium sp. NCIMB 13483]|uniref:Alpha/beta hydrolase n=1 Tax=Photobacterium piscicola TaxID=1378299 RepID=A0A1T5HV46_9GAMM|nr:MULTISPECIES: alpha/beta hydrolase [Photobacterium]MEC6882823.1 alpha/beta hydrolase [Photobacterium piscicola]MEC6900338.1 alpha/beta hydrolase [Photobacterium piscicola]PST93297.1 alpha/beta hydrolase [Photobacterium sp. NCIMB 13483]SKC30603.1 Carboxylesterase NlhH [Photobacterium piscicola]